MALDDVYKLQNHNSASAKKLVSYLHAFNNQSLENFYQTNFDPLLFEKQTIEQLINSDKIRYNFTNGLQTDRLISINDWDLTIIAQAMSNELWFQISLKVSEHPPHGIQEIKVKPITNNSYSNNFLLRARTKLV